MSSTRTRIDAGIPDGEVSYWPQFLDGEEADRLFEGIRNEAAWQQHHVKLFGKVHPCPRLSCWQGEAGAVYRYSGQTLVPDPLSTHVALLRDRLAETIGEHFDGVLLNLYRDGRDAMGLHSDDERELGPRPTIASVSLGARRCFRLKHRTRSDLAPVDWTLEHGSLIVMRGETQQHWRHGVPRTRKAVGERLNLSFRQVARVERQAGAST